jgi:tetratricopeptide (TPR) repeat protein
MVFNAIDITSNEILDFKILEIELAQKGGSNTDVLDRVNGALNVFPNNAVLHQLKLNTVNQIGDSSLLLSTLQNALSHKVNDPTFSTQLLEIYYTNRNFSSFDTLLLLSKNWFPDNDFSVFSSKSLLLKNDFDSAKQLLLAGKTISSLEIESLNVLSEIYLKTGPLDSAIYFAQKSLAKDDEKTHQYHVLAKAYDQLGDFEKAYDYYLKIQEIDKDFYFEADELAKVERKISYLRLRRESND